MAPKFKATTVPLVLMKRANDRLVSVNATDVANYEAAGCKVCTEADFKGMSDADRGRYSNPGVKGCCGTPLPPAKPTSDKAKKAADAKDDGAGPAKDGTPTTDSKAAAAQAKKDVSPKTSPED